MLAACSCSLHALGRAYSGGLQGTAVVGPAKRPGGVVVVNDKRHDPVDQLGDRGELPTLKQPPGKDREEQLRLVQPGGVTGRVVRVKPLVLVEPPAGGQRPMRGAIVENDMHVQLAGDPGVQLAQERDEARCGVAVQVGGLIDPAAVHIQRDEQVRGAMADVLMFLASGPAGAGSVDGRVRLRAPIPVFSSTANTSALSGALRYRPQTSAVRSQNPGTSRRVIQPRTRCGLMSRSARIRPIWDAEIPMSASVSASWVWLQWLAGLGGSRVTVATIRSRSSWP
jgi:hypothetical protein